MCDAENAVAAALPPPPLGTAMISSQSDETEAAEALEEDGSMMAYSLIKVCGGFLGVVGVKMCG